MTTLAIVGAAGSMGGRATERLGKEPDFELLFVENSADGCDRLHSKGLATTPADDAARRAEVVLLAVPDRAIGPVSEQLTPEMKPGAMIICLDPAAPQAGRLVLRDDLACFVTHPAHPPIFNDEVGAEARRDFFGSGLAKQAIVSALVQGAEHDYQLGERIARAMFGPVLRSHRVSLHQMAILEPALSETLAATCLSVIREGMDVAIERGVPAEAARDFLMGHLNVEIAILFDEIDWDFSAGAKDAMAAARRRLFRDDWRSIFDDDELQASVRNISSNGEPS